MPYSIGTYVVAFVDTCHKWLIRNIGAAVSGHFKENQFARPHDVLKHGKKKKKSHGSASDPKDVSRDADNIY